MEIASNSRTGMYLLNSVHPKRPDSLRVLHLNIDDFAVNDEMILSNAPAKLSFHGVAMNDS